MATIIFKNATTGETINVSNIQVVNDREYFFTVRDKGCGTKFFNRNVCFANNGDASHNGKNGTSLILREGWEPVDEPKARKPRKARTPKTKAAEPTSEVPANDPETAMPPSEAREEREANDEGESTPTTEEAAKEAANAPVPEQPQELKRAAAKARLAAKYGKMGADIFEEVSEYSGAKVEESRIAAIVEKKLENMKAAANGERVVVIKINDLPPHKLPKGQEPHELLNLLIAMVRNDRAIGRFPWLYGPAGSGKSTLAKQVADALGLPFYSVSSLQQKYELEGYTDAVGELVKTSFYHAMKEGGIFCFDEASTTSPEVQVAFNTAVAQLIYNFPKEGMVTAHKDFHIIAADNSVGRGGDKKYSARYKLDVSTLDRYTFIEVDYTEKHDLNMANGDKDLVKFIKDVRKALDAANTTYLATPRASRAIANFIAMEMSPRDAVWYGLCSGWNKQDIRTINQRMNGTTKYHRAFNEIASEL